MGSRYPGQRRKKRCLNRPSQTERIEIVPPGTPSPEGGRPGPKLTGKDAEPSKKNRLLEHIEDSEFVPVSKEDIERVLRESPMIQTNPRWPRYR